LVGTGVHQCGQFVEGEDDVRADLVLDPDGHLRGEPVGGSVEVADEGDTVVVDVGQPLLALGDEIVGLLPVHVRHEHLAKPGT